MTQPLAQILCLGLICTALAPASAHAAPAAGASQADPTRTFGDVAFTPCTLAAPGQPITVAARCARLKVPEDRARPGRRSIELAVAWVPSTARHPAPDPVVFLAGGPGQAALEAFPLVAAAFRAVLRQRDVVLVDQRGAGQSHALACPRAFGDAAAVVTQVENAVAARALAERCLDEIGATADPRFYTTGDYVADLEAVRSALRVASVNLVGVSYGTRVALEYLRRHPDRVRTAVLDSVVPATLLLGAEHARNLESAVGAQFERCRRDDACRAKFGDPRARLDALLAQLRQRPVRVQYRDPVTDQWREDELTAAAVAGVVRLHAYAPPLFAMLPMLIDAASRGRYDTLMAQARMVEQLVGEQIGVALQLSVSCAEDAPWLEPDPADRATLLGTQFVEVLKAQCEAWPRGAVARDFHEPVRSQRPVLVFSGEYDPVTPPRYGEQVLETLPHGRQFVLRGQGHGVLGTGCTPELLGEFVQRGDASHIDAKCLDRLRDTPPFAGAYGWDP